jgi:ribosomal protein L14E/L6E/L27E
MVFKSFVQVGRAVLITSGPETGKLGVIGIYNILFELH